MTKFTIANPFVTQANVGDFIGDIKNYRMRFVGDVKSPVIRCEGSSKTGLLKLIKTIK